MVVDLDRLQKLLGPYDRCQLECDGLTRVCSTVLHREQIPHQVFYGQVVYLPIGRRQAPHFWLVIEAESGWFVDYRARMWLAASPEVPQDAIPHGIFLPQQYPDVAYEGRPCELQPLSEEVFAALVMDWEP